MNKLLLPICATALIAGCGASDPPGGGTETETDPPPPDTGIPVLGDLSHDVAQVNLFQVSNDGDPLDIPRDLAWNPTADELWVVNRGDNSTTIFFAAGTPSQTAQWFNSFGSEHFHPQPSALAFGLNGTMATIHEEHEQTQGPNGTPADFMGPTLWPSNSAVYDAGHGSHLDMLHNSPDGMGIAWQQDNAYWVFDGYHNAITLYDFRMDHGPAGEDHSDGFIRRLAEGQVARVPDVPSHMEFHPTFRNLLFIADTGNNRIGLLDTLIGVEGAAITPNYDGANQRYFDNAVITTFIDGAAHGMIHPSGLAIHDGVIYVSDAATGTLYGFDLDDGALIDFLPTGMLPGSLCGITVDTSGGLWLADAINNRIYAIQPLPPQAEPEQ